MKKGLTGVGVGPGDAGLITINAIKAIRECDIILLPNENKDDCYAYKIAKAAYEDIYGDIDDKEIRSMSFPMTKDETILKKAQDNAFEDITGLIDEGKSLVFLTIGDPCVYSTYHYIHRRVAESGRRADIISGVPSFCAVAARLGISLGDKDEEIHIIPATYDVKKAMEYTGTRVYMKSGRKLEELKAALNTENDIVKSQGGSLIVYAVSECGLPGEKVMYGIDELCNQAQLGYLTIVIVKKRI